MQEQQSITFPDEYTCPISRHLMTDPVTTIDGHTFERTAIEKWFHQGNRTNPMTGLQLSSRKLIPNIALKTVIEEFCNQNNQIENKRQFQIIERQFKELETDESLLPSFSSVMIQKRIFLEKIQKSYQNFKDRIIKFEAVAMQYKDGQYEGEMKNGRPHGMGIFLYKNGETYEGQWAEGKKNGFGQAFKIGVGHFKGYWKDDIINGKGILTYLDANEKEYFGEVVDWKREGMGLLEREVGSSKQKYLGNSKQDQRHGRGRYTSHDGWTYEGQWQNDRKHGKGKLSLLNGEVYEGDFLNGFKHGHGFYQEESKNIYQGQWKNDQKHGKGVYFYANGDKFKGTWSKNMRKGKGTLVKQNGQRESSLWQHNKKVQKRSDSIKSQKIPPNKPKYCQIF